MCVFSKDGQILASSSEDCTVRLWRLPSGEPVGTPIRFDYHRGPIALSSDGRLLAVSGLGNGMDLIETWDVESGTKIGTAIQEAGGALLFLSTSAGPLFVLGRQAALFDPQSHERLAPSVAPDSAARSYAVTPDGSRLALGGAAGLLGVWDLATGDRLLPACLQNGRVYDVGFSPSGSQILAAIDDGFVLLSSSSPERSVVG
jgi:WD40 repeat protein